MWSNTSAPWGRYSLQWGPRTPDPTPWEASTLGGDEKLRDILGRKFSPLKFDPYPSLYCTVLMHPRKGDIQDNRQFQTWHGSHFLPLATRRILQRRLIFSPQPPPTPQHTIMQQKSFYPRHQRQPFIVSLNRLHHTQFYQPENGVKGKSIGH